jgi:crotonobetainyl-CoA:carnitine CoA-transferase CaiB-like acyl-CoA transferase
MKPPLTGIKIADFSRVLAGPYATMLLADLGAQVIKVERPGVGDDTRGWGPPFDKAGNSTYFLSVNRNKEGLELDLTKESDQQVAIDLINSSDVVVENFGPGGMEKYNLGYAKLIGNNPKLIYCSISGFGTSEKAASLPGYDLLLQGMSGLMSITGSDENNPAKVGVALVDVITGLHAVVGILSALRARDEQGIGQKVELNLLSSTLSALRHTKYLMQRIRNLSSLLAVIRNLLSLPA